MARFLLATYHSNNQSLPSSSSNNTISLFLLLAGVAGIASIVMSLCTTYKHSKMRKDSQSGLAVPSSPPQKENKLLSQINSKALVVIRMVSLKKGEQVEVEDDDDDDDDDEAVWRKTILMGDKCRPVDFSGQILYDSQGNPLPEPPARSHGSS